MMKVKIYMNMASGGHGKNMDQFSSIQSLNHV